MRQFYGRLEKCVLSAGQSHVHKIPRFRGGGYFGFFFGGGSADFIFMGARIFLKFLECVRRCLARSFWNGEIFVEGALTKSKVAADQKHVPCFAGFEDGHYDFKHVGLDVPIRGAQFAAD